MAASLALGLCLPAAGAAAEMAAPPAATTIIVTGQRDGVTGLDRLPTPLLDTPQVIEVISAVDLQARGITNLNDALRGVAGLSLGAGETSFQGNNAILRGFTTRNDLYVDNARDYGYYYRDTFDDDRVEVVKGPSSTLFGRGSTGGVIHRVSKVPLAADRFAAEAQLGSDDTRRLAVDANIADVAGPGSAFRINAVVHRSAVAGRAGGYFERWGVAPTLSLGMGTPTRVILSFLHQQEANRPDYGIPWIAGTPAAPGYPAPVDRATYYGFSNDRLHTDVNILTARLAHDVSPTTQLRGQIRYSNNSRDFRYSEAVIPPGTPRDAPLSGITIGRNLFEGRSRDRFFQVQGEIETRLQLWPGEHRIIAGAEAGTEATDPTYVTNPGVPRTSLVDPVGGFYDSAPNSFVRLRGRARSQFVGVFGIDSIDLSPHWQVLIGLRWDRFATRYDSTRFAADGSSDRGTAVDRADRKLSYRGALVWKPVHNASVYAAYANSFNPSGEGVESLISSGRAVGESNINLVPENSHSIEFGAKWNLADGRLQMSSALFRIDKANVRVPDPGTPGLNISGGKQRVDGAEIELAGEPLPGWSVKASYAWLDGRTVQSTPGGPLVGAPLLLTPRHSGSISTAVDVAPRFNVGLNMVFASSRLGQNGAASYLLAGGYAVANASLAWRMTDRLTLRLLVNNIADRLYYDQLHPAHVIPGAGRSALVTLAVVL